MKCYRCKTSVLKPTKLAPGLPAKSCSNCSGALVDLLSYRSWKEASISVSENRDEQFDPTSIEEGKTALNCQRCSKIMLRYRISAQYENFVDVCTTCDCAWLDRGEWALLQHLEAQGKLTDIMTIPWQSAVRDEEMASLTQNRLHDEIGTEGADKLKDFVQWYANLEQKSAAARFLRAHSVP